MKPPRQSAPEFIVYGLVSPESGRLIYVGKSSGGTKRPLGYMQKSNLYAPSAKTPLYLWLRALKARGLAPEVEILERAPTHEALCDAEQHWIGYAKFIGCRLLNRTLGGVGAYGMRHTEKTKAKLAALARGRKHSQETKDKLAAISRGRVKSDETRRRLSESLRGRTVPQELRARISASLKGRRLSPQERLERAAKCGVAVVDDRGQVYESQAAAAHALGVKQGHISEVLAGTRKSAGGHTFTRHVPDSAPGSHT